MKAAIVAYIRALAGEQTSGEYHSPAWGGVCVAVADKVEREDFPPTQEERRIAFLEKHCFELVVRREAAIDDAIEHRRKYDALLKTMRATETR